MRFDIVTIFPEYFDSLKLSLLGKAEAKGVLDFSVSNLRDWAEGRHLSVDDTPYGGGAGMVMRADVWGRALKEIFSKPLRGAKTKRILAVPTPSGIPLTQGRAEELAATAGQIVFACGRYEGIDNRIMDHYQVDPKIELWQFSLGDYVLNGGEVATMAAIEAIARLAEGFMGNPDSLQEESHSGIGLLEYPVFTKPLQWENHRVPAVLLGGNHADIQRWRRDQSLFKTYQNRPDIIAKIDPKNFDSEDRAVLAAAGFLATASSRCRFFEPEPEAAPAISELAQSLFPNACPDFLDEGDIADFVTEKLGVEQVELWLKAEQYRVLVAEIETETGWELVGYCLFEKPLAGRKVPEIAHYRITTAATAYISKCYIKPGYYGSGVAFALMEIGMARLSRQAPDISRFLLGTNSYNRGAQKFYKKLGFSRRGTRSFKVGNQDCRDVLMVRELTTRPIRHWAQNM